MRGFLLPLTTQLMSIYKSYSKKALLIKHKKQRTIVIIQFVIVFLMVVLAILATLSNGINGITFLPFFFAPMLFLMIFELKKIKKEVQNRSING